GQPYEGFPEALRRIIVKGEQPNTVQPGKVLEPANFSDMISILEKTVDHQVTSYDVISYALYPHVYKDYQKFHEKFADVSVLDTLTFFYGMRLGEEIEVEIEEGKTLFIKLVCIS